MLRMVMAGIAGIGAHRGTAQEKEKEETRSLWGVLLLLSAVAAILMIRPSSVFWEHLPKLRFVQFPWRWMAILAVPYGYFLAAAVERQRRVWLWAVAVIVVICGTTSFFVLKAWGGFQAIPVFPVGAAK